MSTEKKNKNDVYDIIIIGGGPAGISAAIYAARYNLKTLIISKQFGGTAAKAHLIENYPGIPQMGGTELMNEFIKHMNEYDVEKVTEEVRKIERNEKDETFKVRLEKKDYVGRTVVLALGTKRRKLNIPGEKELLGKGVSYCATCDAMFFKDKVASVVGGSDAAVMAAILLAQHAKKVYIVYRNEKLRAEPIWVDRAEEHEKVEIIRHTNVVGVKGENKVESIELDNEFQGSKSLVVDGMFVEIGAVPAISLAKDLGVETNDRDLIVVDKNAETTVPGVYAAGDLTVGLIDLWQIVTAAAEGALAATSAYKKLMTSAKRHWTH